MSKPNDTALALGPGSAGAVADQLNALFQTANAGDRTAIAKLQRVLDKHPEMWNEVGDLGKQVELALVEAAVGKGTLAKTAVQRKLDALRMELLAESSSPIERLLVDRVAVTWLALAIVEGAYFRSLTEGIDSFEEELHQKRIERAQRRHLAAIKTLAQVRKLGAPVMQVNIGEKQINMAATGR